MNGLRRNDDAMKTEAGIKKRIKGQEPRHKAKFRRDFLVPCPLILVPSVKMEFQYSRIQLPDAPGRNTWR
jgi:hypothetical protein